MNCLKKNQCEFEVNEYIFERNYRKSPLPPAEICSECPWGAIIANRSNKASDVVYNGAKKNEGSEAKEL